jgi:hypothetical protein
MSQKRYENKCLECKQPFVSKKAGSKFCSGACRARYAREKKEAEYQVVIKSQVETIKTQAKIITRVMPDPGPAVTKGIVEDVSCKTGKDLTECKRADGTHLYTEQDLWILIAKLLKVGFTGTIRNYLPAGEDFLHAMYVDRLSQDLISDFERRFSCKFDDVRRNTQYIVQKDRTEEEEKALISKYVSLSYSR